MPRPPLTSIDAQRIALLKPSALGDIVHALPVLHALRERFPQARISWVVGRAYAPLLHGHPDLDETITFDRRGGLRSALVLARELRRRRFDLVIDLQGLLRTGLMCAAAPAARRIGLTTAREGARLFYTDVVQIPDPEATHAVGRYWLVAEALGAGRVVKRFDVPVNDDALSWANAMLRGLPRPWLVIAPGSRWLTKRWPHFADLVRRTQREHGGSAILVGGSDEAALARGIPGLDLIGKTTLPQLAALLSRADVMLANDSGPLHLAAALGRRVIAPYTCTKIVKHGPYSSPGAVASTVPCHGSYLKRCGSLACMSELTPDRLWPALDEALSSCQSRSRSA
jgi:heptosyltransferase-1